MKSLVSLESVRVSFKDIKRFEQENSKSRSFNDITSVAQENSKLTKHSRRYFIQCLMQNACIHILLYKFCFSKYIVVGILISSIGLIIEYALVQKVC